MKTVTAEHAAELILALLKANSWLNTPGVMTKDDFHAKDEAILFLQQMAIHGASNFGSTSQLTADNQRIFIGLNKQTDAS